jgi:hypothetical protein
VMGVLFDNQIGASMILNGRRIYMDLALPDPADQYEEESAEDRRQRADEDRANRMADYDEEEVNQ